jgi:hypothetical protein
MNGQAVHRNGNNVEIALEQVTVMNDGYVRADRDQRIQN